MKLTEIKQMQREEVTSLGVMSYCSHDPAAAFLRFNGKSIDTYLHFEEGMLSRRKKSYHFPLRSIMACLHISKTNIEDVSALTMDYMDNKTFLGTSNNYRRLVGDYIRENLRVKPEQVIRGVNHHDGHAYSAFYSSKFENAAILAIDGLGSKQRTHSIYIADRRHGIKRIFSQTLPGIGELYTLITLALGFDAGEEGKTMGLAAYGLDTADPHFAEIASELEGRFNGFVTDYSKQVRRAPSAELKLKLDARRLKEDLYEGYPALVAAAVQNELERSLRHLATEIKKVTGEKKLVIAGGVGLNCVANEYLVNLEIFNDIYVHADSGDAGIPLGLALIGLEKKLRERKYTESEIQGILSTFEYPKCGFGTHAMPLKKDHKKLLEQIGVKTEIFDAKKIAENIKSEQIVALFSGEFELGPRALGHRSFLASPLTSSMKAVMNSKIKHREAYRPFAPIVLQEDFSRYFESKHNQHDRMLYAVKCKTNATNEIPAVVHHDGTARAQTISEEESQVVLILREFKRQTGVGVLINTSFNDNDEPIVLDEVDALVSFLRTNADILILNDVVVRRTDFHDVSNALNILTKEQSNTKEEYYKKAIGELLYRKPVKSLREFKNESIALSAYHAKYRKKNEMVYDLENGNYEGYETIYIDAHHVEIMKELALISKVNINEILKKCIIIKDEYSEIDEIDISKNAISFHYNLSTIIRVEFNQRFPNLQFFYAQADKIIERTLNIDNDYQDVLETYEVNGNKTINEFFE
ncbi:carbamoyltransferase C-terminal domain-containing protein [Betaproteobacteria bacterium LSUCC0117]|nr:carbamoyltransferase C-terminal domain-containing protein [Betaproteobacteria bacterium LSUCC0117]